MTSTPEAFDGAEASSPVAEPPVADARLLAAHDLARTALGEVTPASTVGDPAGYTVEADGVVSLRFYNRLAGYPNWFWTVSVAVVDESEPTVLEVELLPGDGALLAPEWVPWAERLADYQAAQAAQAEADDELADDDDDELIDDEDELGDIDDLDAADFDDDGSPILHAGDLDGVDIDELDDSHDADDADDSDDEPDDADDSDDDAADDADDAADSDDTDD